MAAIGSIRKHGVALMVIIGLALLAFILGDLSQVTRTFSNDNIMVRVDGKKMDKTYTEQYEQNTALMRLLQNKVSFDENETYQIHEMTWRQMLQDQVVDAQLEKLGLSFSEQMVEDFTAEMIASLNSQRPNQYMMQFAQALAQQVGPENAMAVIANIEDYAYNDQVRDLYNAYTAIVRFALSAEKSNRYFALTQNSIYFSDPMAKKLSEDNRLALVSMMAINPQSPSFNGVTAEVSESDMKTFYKSHKEDLFQVYEKNCDLDVAVFPINPTAGDLKAIEDSVRADFAHFSTSDLLAYSLEKGNGSVDSMYYNAEDIQLEILDSLIFKVPVGSFIEPFSYENQIWYFGKVFGAAARPDSMLVATIELPFRTSQNDNARYSKKEARLLADSLKEVINGRQTSIFDLRAEFMSDIDRTADSTFWLVDRGTIQSLYNDLVATSDGGTYVYKAPNGYIVFQVLSRTAPIEKRQFVLYDYVIEASDATVNSIKSQANQFAASVNNADELVENAAKQGIQTVKGTNVLSMASTISQLPNCRDIVSWAFSKDVKKNDISDVINVERMFYAVAAVREIRETGTQKYKEVKEDIKNLLESEKRVDLVTDQINGSISGDMQAMAQQYATQVMDSVFLSFTGDAYQNRNVGSKAIGQIFSLPTNKPTAVHDNNMVYVVNLAQINDNSASTGYSMEKNILRNEVIGRERSESTIINYLITNANVLDNRYRFYLK